MTAKGKMIDNVVPNQNCQGTHVNEHTHGSNINGRAMNNAVEEKGGRDNGLMHVLFGFRTGARFQDV